MVSAVINKRRWSFLWKKGIVLLCLWVASPVVSAETTTSVPDEIPSPSVSTNPYVLRPSDLIRISVYNQPDLTTEQRIDADGRVKIPLLGDEVLGGMGIREAELYLQNQFVAGRFLRNPEVTLVVVEYASKSVYVFGEVNQPGKIDFESEVNAMDIVEVIALAGDFTGIAKENAVVVTRRTKEGKEINYTLNVQDKILGRPARKTEEEPIFVVVPGDVIFVPESIF